MKLLAMLAALALVAGCVETATSTSTTMIATTTPPATPSNATVPQARYTGTVLAGTAAPLLDFTAADYTDAMASDKLIVLYFYADWCPICRTEFPNMQHAFNQLTTDKAIGFRVNYNDGNVDDYERTLAAQLGIAYQHTKVLIKNKQVLLKSPESWVKDRYLMEITTRV